MKEHDISTTSEAPDKPTLEQEKGAWPQHELLASYLRDGILSGDFPAGSLLPSTRLLREKFGVAPQTIKHANDQLASEGLVRSHRGKGIIVLDRRPQTVVPAATKRPANPGDPYRWITEASKSGLQGASVLLDVDEVVPPKDVARALGLGASGVALRREQVLTLDGEPAEYVRAYYPVDIARGTEIAVRKRIRGGTPRVLQDLGYPPLRCVDTVSARVPTPDEVKALGTPTKVPVLRTLRVVHSVDDRVVEVAVMAKAGHLYELQYDF
ncbi:GntR family transcriptional regulator [Kitasatospora sp. NPDC048239]|uniref:GntR family transcriptional regulator n=1 Tax=Kitasatospora sp. NPDC048239 TaxID=3364046 RepID=UPI00371A43F0